MKLIGMIGGTTWYSTFEYYRLINQFVNQKLGLSHSAKLLLYSVDFEEFKPSTDMNHWIDRANRFTEIALKLQQAGAECLILCANTPHLIADKIIEKISIPLIHIAEATASSILATQIDTVALLGTKVTMEQSFFKDILKSHAIESLVPEEKDQDNIHDSILKELGKGILREETKSMYLKIINQLVAKGAKGIILGCTEIPLLIKQEDVDVPIFDTTLIHSKAVVDFALG